MTSKTKTLRPQVTLDVEGRKIMLRPTQGALESIEDRCKAGISKLYRRLTVDDDARFSDFAVILEETSRAANPKEALSYDEAFELAQNHFIDVGKAVLELLAGSFGPPPDGAAANPPTAT